jgi:glycosyltransferase involved in cell wall biosynthesis
MPELMSSRLELKESNLFIRIIGFIERLSCKLADSIITVNNTIKNNLIKKGVDSKKIEVAYNSADEELFNGNLRKTKKTKFGFQDKFIILYQGAIMKRRGLQTLIKSIDILRDKIPNICCIILGDGDYLFELKKLIKKLKLEDKVILKGRVPIKMVPEYIAISDICVIPFTKAPINQIGSPNKLFEYTVYKKPMIISNHKTMRSIFSDKEAFYFEPEDFNDLADKILFLYNHHKEAELRAQSAYLKYKKNYSWDKMKKRLLNVYLNRL